MRKIDMLIIGGGPAGITAGIYAKRSGLDVLISEKKVLGGQVVNNSEVKNYTGFKDITGGDLAYKFFEHCTDAGVEVNYSGVEKIVKNGELNFDAYLSNGEIINAKTIIIAGGALPRKLNMEDEEKLLGKGLAYCAYCDGNFYKDKVVAVIGGGNSAFEDANYLAGICKKTYILVRKNIRADEILVSTAKNNPNIEILLNTTVEKFIYEDKLKQIIVHNFVENTNKIIDVDGVFVAIGSIPDTKIYEGLIDLDKEGRIITDEHLMTSCKGIYAAGDIRVKDFRQIVTAVSDGAIASSNANLYVKRGK